LSRWKAEEVRLNHGTRNGFCVRARTFRDATGRNRS
jgi:hypothetical protein